MDVDVKETSTTRLLSRSIYRPYRAKGHSYGRPYSVIQHLKHTGSLGWNQGLIISACTFGVHNDSLLITQTTFPSTNVIHTFKAGFIQSWDLTDVAEGHDNSLFTYAPRPEFSISPNEGIVCTILNSGKGVLILAQIDEDCTLEPCKFECISKFGSDNLSARTVSCVYSPDGTLMVTVSIVLFNALIDQQYHEMCLWRVRDGRVLQKCLNIRCENYLPGFSGQPQSCVFSDDCSLIAISTTNSQLYVLKSNTLEVYAVVRSMATLNDYCMCSFDPCESTKKLSVCFSNGLFQVWKVRPGNVQCIFEEDVLSLNTVKLTSMAYSLDHSLVAFGTTMGIVIIYETDSYRKLYNLFPNRIDNDIPLQVCSVSFAKSCQELAVGYDDGHARLWQLPVKMDLLHICRLEIIQLVPEDMICKLPLPEPLRTYLMFKVSVSVGSSDI